ncbi:hypothetical protein N005_18080 [Pseudomonas mediterranea CFBP 5447]|nr:hypothetical protein N005_18080 [Pseudomonas mediterranea CFBP 5447]
MALRGGPTEQCRSEGTPRLGEVPSGGAQPFWLLLGRLPKVTRRKGGTLSRRYRSNGYVPGHREQARPPITRPSPPPAPDH